MALLTDLCASEHQMLLFYRSLSLPQWNHFLLFPFHVGLLTYIHVILRNYVSLVLTEVCYRITTIDAFSWVWNLSHFHTFYFPNCGTVDFCVCEVCVGHPGRWSCCNRGEVGVGSAHPEPLQLRGLCQWVKINFLVSFSCHHLVVSDF